ncbi:transposase [Chamaesiphon minutus]|uniref:transposase n=1 Tax=Chamaesiphon minutus TaxID=1173032 RepID=UPI000301CB6D|nr:transposase [Chamaesiphon minutus]
MKQIIAKKNDIYLREMQVVIESDLGIKVSTSSLCRTLERWKLRRKKTLIDSERQTHRVKNLRYEWRQWLDKVDVRNLVFIDETGVNLSMNRRYGRGEGGVRVYDDCPGKRGKNLTLIGAMSDEGLIVTMTLTGGLDTASFLVDK